MTATVTDLTPRLHREAAVKPYFCDPAKNNGCGSTNPDDFAPKEHSRCRNCRKADKRAWHAAHGRAPAAPKPEPVASEPVAQEAPAPVFPPVTILPAVEVPKPVAADGIEATFARDAFCAALSDVLKVVAKTPGIPVLGGVRIEAKGSTLTLTATDLDITVERTVNASVRAEGVALVPGKLTHPLVARMSKGSILRIEDHDGNVSITADARWATLAGLNADDFPKEALGEFSEPVTFDAAELVPALRAAVTTASTDEAHPMLCGVWFDFAADGRMDLVSTDKYRLGIAPVHYSGAVPIPSGAALVPAKALKLLAGLVGGEEVTAAFSGTHAVFAADGLRMVVRLTLGRIPAYHKLIPAEALALTLDAPVLADAVSYVATVVGANTPVGLAIDGDTLTVQASEKGVGEASERIVVYNGGVVGMTWAGDPDFIDAGLRYVGSASVELQVTGPNDAAVIRGGGRTYVLMPFLVNAAA